MMASAIIRARVDRAGRLISADPPILALQHGIGGTIGGPLLIPQLSRLCALVQRMGTPLGRPVIAADEQQDYSMWCRFIPDADGTAMELTDWTETPRHAISGAAETAPEASVLSSDWMWRSDAQLRLTALWPDPQNAALAIDTYLGKSITELFGLLPDEFGRFPLLAAMAQEQEFTGQVAELIARMPQDAHPPRYQLSGTPIFEDNGRFGGFSGRAQGPGNEPSSAATVPEPMPPAPQGTHSAAPFTFGKDVDASMRAPLGRIIANADSISARTEGPIRQDYANYARDIALAGRHLLGLIDDLADMQAIERPNFAVAKEAVDLADVARRAAGLLQVKLREKSMAVKLPSADDDAIATGEFRRILQILINLLGNAVRYAPEGSEIWVSTDAIGDHVSITIADQGAGISPQDQARIFEKFERLGRSDHGGSGLGLYISRRLARAMQGELSVESAPGQGARFTLSLPRHSA
jgi:signal transduction histidine kinase